MLLPLARAWLARSCSRAVRGRRLLLWSGARSLAGRSLGSVACSLVGEDAGVVVEPEPFAVVERGGHSRIVPERERVGEDVAHPC